jgi:hypothetical protein
VEVALRIPTGSVGHTSLIEMLEFRKNVSSEVLGSSLPG